MNAQRAFLIAAVAHGACGQKRADGVTPYIEHPKKVARLTEIYARQEAVLSNREIDDAIVAAYLHDVLEDTKLTESDLLDYGITGEQLDTVRRMTKPGMQHERATEFYYQGISESIPALIVKCADRVANLEDSLNDLLAEVPQNPRRWDRYTQDTRDHVLPMYKMFPGLRRHLETVLFRIDLAMPDALQRRGEYVAERRKIAA